MIKGGTNGRNILDQYQVHPFIQQYYYNSVSNTAQQPLTTSIPMPYDQNEKDINQPVRRSKKVKEHFLIYLIRMPL